MSLLGPLFFDNRPEVKAARIIAQSNAEHDKALKSISESEIKAKDRVDISRDEYESMKREIECLRRQSNFQSKLIIRMGIPAEVIEHIDLSSVDLHIHRDEIKMRTWYQLYFATDREV